MKPTPKDALGALADWLVDGLEVDWEMVRADNGVWADLQRARVMAARARDDLERRAPLPATKKAPEP